MKRMKHMAVVFALLTAGGGVCPAQIVLTTNTYSPVVDCPAAGQFCNNTYDVAVQTAGTLMVRFTASSGHCSAIYMHFIVDGREAALAGPLGPGESTTNLDLGPVSFGSHSLKLLAEGFVNGCNVGDIVNWGGWLEVVTSSPCAGFATLAMDRAGTNVLLSWPQAASNYVLESSVVLPNVGGWTLQPEPASLAGDRFWVTNAIAPRTRFYRLRATCLP